ncbi:MAG: alpha-N-arabinofuranosidase, partial [Bryocella sp.]
MKIPALVAAIAVLTSTCAAQTAQLKIDPANIVSPVSSTLYGLMTEEINHSYEGGLYAQLLSNQTFRAHWDGVEGWQLVRNGNAHARIAQDKTTGPSAALTTSMKLAVESASAGSEAGVSNHGFWGIAVRPHTEYKGSMYARVSANTTVTARLISDTTGKTLAQTIIPLHAGNWSQYAFTLCTAEVPVVSAANHFEMTVDKPSTIWLQLV